MARSHAARRWLYTLVAFVVCASTIQIVAGSSLSLYAAWRGAYEWLRTCLIVNARAYDDLVFARLQTEADVLADAQVAAFVAGAGDAEVARTLDVAWWQPEAGDAWTLLDDARGRVAGGFGCDDAWGAQLARLAPIPAAARRARQREPLRAHGIADCRGQPRFVVRASTECAGGVSLWVSRPFDERYVSALQKFTGSEVAVVTPARSITTMKNVAGEPVAVPLPGVVVAGAGAEWFGLVEARFPGGGYRGFGKRGDPDQAQFMRGTPSLRMFAAARRLGGADTNAWLVLLAPARIMTVGAVFSALAMFLVGLVATAIFLVVARRLAARFSRPLVAVERGARAVADGDADVRLPVDGLPVDGDGDAELASVALSFNTMLDKLAESQQALVRTEKLAAMGQLAAGVVHELNTPLHFVTENTEFVKSTLPEVTFSDPELKSEVPRALDDALEGLRRLAVIVTAMKELSHGSRGSKSLCDLGQLVETTLIISRAEWKYVADASVDVDADVPPVPVVRDELSQALLNLVVNAAHAIQERYGADEQKPGRIDIRVRRTGDHAVVRVGDNGAGMPAAVRARLFEPFFTTKPVGKGTGQGLGIVYAVVVKRHGGTIAVDSTPGVGTTFTLTLPLHPPPSAHAGQAGQAAQGPAADEHARFDVVTTPATALTVRGADR